MSNTTLSKLRKVLACPKCRGPLEHHDITLACNSCWQSYMVKDNVPYILDHKLSDRYEQEARLPINKFKALIKRYPWLFQFLTYAIGSISYLGMSPQKAMLRVFRKEELDEKVIINVGSGIKRIHRSVINLDIFPFRNVDLVTNATALPLKDDSVDMIITESTLEHIPNTYIAMRELARVVKSGGFIYVSIPFLMPFHASPSDYGRLTAEGLKYHFSDFEAIKTGMRGGPMSALITFIMFFIPLPLSLISKSLYQFATYAVMIFLTPLRIFDLIFYLFPSSVEVAAIVYFLGRKKLNPKS